MRLVMLLSEGTAGNMIHIIAPGEPLRESKSLGYSLSEDKQILVTNASKHGCHQPPKAQCKLGILQKQSERLL